MGIASVSIVSSQNPCYNTPPSGCQECMTNWCESWCSQNQELDSQFPNGYSLCDFCSIEAFFECQIEWFHPYWMEIYNNNVKGCYARDLLCVNDLVENHYCPLECKHNCQNQECWDECCERAYCYLYGPPSKVIYPPQVPSKEGPNPPLIINVPSCNDSRKFFNEPPPCAGEGDFSLEDRKLINSCCFDMRGCGSNPSLECATPCSGYYMPANYKCDVNEYVIMEIEEGYGVKINGIHYDLCAEYDEIAKEGYSCTDKIVWYNGERPFDPTPGVVMILGVPRTITIEGDGDQFYLEFSLEQKCCYDCKPKPSIPATILYPKVDIETLSITGGSTVIKDGKVIASLTSSPGVQQAVIQVENRGFFTQNDTRVRFEGLPEGVTAAVSPETQKIKAHNINTYSATFTVDPNVPSGTYKVTIYAYSPSGVFDTATIDFVVP